MMFAFTNAGDTPKLQDVFKEIFGLASHWKSIGTLLGLKSHLLDNIKREPMTVCKKCYPSG